MELFSNNVGHGYHFATLILPGSSLLESPINKLLYSSGALISVAAVLGTSLDCKILVASGAYTCGPVYICIF